MRHLLLLIARLLLLTVALYAVSNALKELLLREDHWFTVALLIGSNMLVAAVCWSLGCSRRFEKAPRRRASSAQRTTDRV